MLSQLAELLFQGLQMVDTLADLGDLRLDQLIDLAAIGLGLRCETQQPGDIGQPNIQKPTATDEAQSLQMRRAIAAVAVAEAGRRGQQTDFFVVAHGVHRGLGLSGQFADLHGGFETHTVC